MRMVADQTGRYSNFNHPIQTASAGEAVAASRNVADKSIPSTAVAARWFSANAVPRRRQLQPSA